MGLWISYNYFNIMTQQIKRELFLTDHNIAIENVQTLLH